MLFSLNEIYADKKQELEIDNLTNKYCLGLGYSIGIINVSDEMFMYLKEARDRLNENLDADEDEYNVTQGFVAVTLLADCVYKPFNWLNFKADVSLGYAFTGGLSEDVNHMPSKFNIVKFSGCLSPGIVFFNNNYNSLQFHTGLGVNQVYFSEYTDTGLSAKCCLSYTKKFADDAGDSKNYEKYSHFSTDRNNIVKSVRIGLFVERNYGTSAKMDFNYTEVGFQIIFDVLKF